MVKMHGTMVWCFILFVVLGCQTQDVLAVQVDVEHKELTVIPGQNATFMCRVGLPLQYCRVEIPGLEPLNLNIGLSKKDVSYSGKGLDTGECGFTINRVQDLNNGQVKCTLGIQSEAAESIGTMTLTVARAPKFPELDVSGSYEVQHDYKINDILQASCVVRDGRPVANMSWFIDEDPIDNSELSMPTVIDLAKENLQSKIQNLTRQLRASDNGRYLRCVAYHGAYPDGQAETKRQLEVKYPPLPQQDPIEEFGFEVGKVGIVNVTIEANPKPNIEWTVNGQKIREGSVDNSGSIEAEVAREMGSGRYLANLRIARISKQDTEKEYILTAYNNMGSQEYRVKISTAPEPKGWEIGVASIIGIVVGILVLILAISILIFAKVTDRWCFSGPTENRFIGESSDTESADVRPRDEQKRRLRPIKLPVFFKKDKPKDQKEVDVTTQIDNEEIDTEEANMPESETAVDGSNRNSQPEGLVYAELNLTQPQKPAVIKPVVKSGEEQTEYAEILYTPQDQEELQNQQPDEKSKREEKEHHNE